MSGELASSEGSQQLSRAGNSLSGVWSFLGRLRAPQLFALSFLLLIVLGTFALKLPGVVADGHSLSWLDALFTSTSAVCVTGLIVVDTSEAFTFGGQFVILTLIQLGGLGMLSFTSLIILTLGGRATLELEDATSGGAEVAPQLDRRHVARNILKLTLACELLGALALWVLWGRGGRWSEELWPAIFHSVSAFCNAGFSTNSDSLVPHAGSPMTLLVISLLIVVGGLGFITNTELAGWVKRRVGLRRSGRLSLHARLTVVTSLALLVGGWGLLTFFEWGEELAGFGAIDKLSNGLFMSVTARTAGFNTIDYGSATSGSNLLTIMLMFAGGAAGGTAGGVKVTTVALIALLAWNRIRGRRQLLVFSRTVPASTVDRAVGVSFVALTLTVIGLLVLTRTEIFGDTEGRFLQIMFEAFSAFNTVGLSMGSTGDLSATGRWTIIVLMFVGRIGPLTAAAAVARKLRYADRFRYAHEDVIVG